MLNFDLEVLSRPARIGPRKAPNRLVNQPMECNDAEPDGNPSELTLRRYRLLAEGGAGLIHIESASVAPGSLARKNQLMAGPGNTDGLTRLIESMKKINRESLIILQINHSGAVSGAFSEIVSYYPVSDPSVRILSDEEIETIRERFVSAARVARKAGADGIDLKMCHGYLGGQLLRPANTKEGRYGGGFDNRTRFFRETLTRIKTEINDESFLLGCRFSFYEGIPGGFGTAGPEEVIEDSAEPLAFCRLAEETGVHFLNVSGGIPSITAELTRPTKAYPQGVYRQFGWAAEVKRAVGLTVIGSAYSYLRDGRPDLTGPDGERKSLLYWACKNIGEGRTDLVGVGRQSLADPHFAKKVLAGESLRVDYCKSCGGCSVLLGSQARVGCAVFDDLYREELKRVKAAGR